MDSDRFNTTSLTVSSVPLKDNHEAHLHIRTTPMPSAGGQALLARAHTRILDRDYSLPTLSVLVNLVWIKLH